MLVISLSSSFLWRSFVISSTRNATIAPIRLTQYPKLEPKGKDGIMQALQKAAQVAILALLPCVVGGLSQAQILGAQQERPSDESVPAALASVAQNHLLKGSYINTNRPTTSTNIAGGIVPIDALTTVTCPGTTGTCTIEFDQLVQIGGTGTDNNVFQLCQSLDGNFLAPGCYVMGTVPFAGPPIFASSSQTVSGVAVGTHQVRSSIETQYGAALGFYNMTYRVYKP